MLQRTTSRFDLTNCPKCRYDLTGSPRSGRCPECGGEYDESMFTLDVFNPKLNQQASRLETWSSVSLAGLLTILGSLGMLRFGAVLGLFIMGSIAIFIIVGLYRRWRAWKRLPDVTFLFSTEGVWIDGPRGFRRLCRWRDLRRIRLSRRRRNRWTMRLIPRVWRSFTMVQQTVKVQFQGSIRDAAVLRRRVRQLAEQPGVRRIRW